MGTHERVIFSHAHIARATRKAHANNHKRYGFPSITFISLLFALCCTSSMLVAPDATVSDPARLLLVAYWAEKAESPLLATYLDQFGSSLESRASQLAQKIANLKIAESEQE